MGDFEDFVISGTFPAFPISAISVFPGIHHLFTWSCVLSVPELSDVFPEDLKESGGFLFKWWPPRRIQKKASTLIVSMNHRKIKYDGKYET